RGLHVLVDQPEGLIRVFDPEPGNNNVDNGDQKNKNEDDVVEDNGGRVVAVLVNVEASDDHEQNGDDQLQDDRDADQAQHQDVEFVLFADLQDVFELGGVGGEEGYVEEALRDGLLRRIFVRVQRFQDIVRNGVPISLGPSCIIFTSHCSTITTINYCFRSRNRSSIKQ
ncbi:unnamed protein product, partial [Tenebrio molitor]